MTIEPDIHRTVLKSLWEAPGGNVWEDILRSLPELDIYLAGGAVRDALANRVTAPKDFDIFAGGKDVETLLERLAAKGRLEYGPFGSPRWYPAANVPLYHDVIPVSRFFNGLWRCENITDVLNQFDFTVNAVGLDLRTGELFDPQNGRRDIRQKIMRAVRFDYPDEPIADKVSLTRLEILWFRILHYAAALKLEIEPVTRAWLHSHQRYESVAGQFTELFFILHPDWKSGLETTPHAR